MTKLRDLVAKWREMGKGCTDYAEGNSLQEDTEVVMNRILGRCADELETALAAHSAAPIEREALQALLDSCTKRRGGTQTLTMPSWKAVEDAEIALGQHVNQAGQDKPTRAGEPK